VIGNLESAEIISATEGACGTQTVKLSGKRTEGIDWCLSAVLLLMALAQYLSWADTKLPFYLFTFLERINA